MDTIGFIGGGNMAQALIEGVVQKKLFAPERIWVSDVRAERLAELKARCRIQTTPSNTELAAAVDCVVLSVKPQVLGSILDEIAGSLRPKALVISIAAGKTCDFILRRLGDVQLVRVMPNTPALAGVGAAGLYNATASPSAMRAAIELFDAVGKTVVVDNEDLIDAVTAVSGSGPAYFFLLMEAMIGAGCQLGLAPEAAAELVLQTALGAAVLAQNEHENGHSPEILRQNVTSPGGTTEAAITTLQEGRFGLLVRSAMVAARDRAKELSADR